MANIHRPACVFTVCAYIHSSRACGELDWSKVTKYADYAWASQALLIFGMWADKLGEGGAFVLHLCSYIPPLSGVFFLSCSQVASQHVLSLNSKLSIVEQEVNFKRTLGLKVLLLKS